MSTLEFSLAVSQMKTLVENGQPEQAYRIRWDLWGRQLTVSQAYMLFYFDFRPASDDERED